MVKDIELTIELKLGLSLGLAVGNILGFSKGFCIGITIKFSMGILECSWVSIQERLAVRIPLWKGGEYVQISASFDLFIKPPCLFLP